MLPRQKPPFSARAEKEEKLWHAITQNLKVCIQANLKCCRLTCSSIKVLPGGAALKDVGKERVREGRETEGNPTRANQKVIGLRISNCL